MSKVAATTNKGRAVIPVPADILCGKTSTSRHPGNLYLRELILSYVSTYMETREKRAKSEVVLTVMALLEGYGCRFLRQDHLSGKWYVVPEFIVREKVGHALRDRVRERRKGRFIAPREDILQNPPRGLKNKSTAAKLACFAKNLNSACVSSKDKTTNAAAAAAAATTAFVAMKAKTTTKKTKAKISATVAVSTKECQNMKIESDRKQGPIISPLYNHSSQDRQQGSIPQYPQHHQQQQPPFPCHPPRFMKHQLDAATAMLTSRLLHLHAASREILEQRNRESKKDTSVLEEHQRQVSITEQQQQHMQQRQPPFLPPPLPPPHRSQVNNAFEAIVASRFLPLTAAAAATASQDLFTQTPHPPNKQDKILHTSLPHESRNWKQAPHPRHNSWTMRTGGGRDEANSRCETINKTTLNHRKNDTSSNHPVKTTTEKRQGSIPHDTQQKPSFLPPPPPPRGANAFLANPPSMFESQIYLLSQAAANAVTASNMKETSTAATIHQVDNHNDYDYIFLGRRTQKKEDDDSSMTMLANQLPRNNNTSNLYARQYAMHGITWEPLVCTSTIVCKSSSSSSDPSTTTTAAATKK